MPERLFPTLERTDLIVQAYDTELSGALMGTDSTPRPGSSVEFDTGTTVTFQGSFVRRAEPGPDVLLFAVETAGTGDGEAITAWLTEALRDDPFASVETPDGFVDLETDDLVATLEGPLAAD